MNRVYSAASAAILFLGLTSCMPAEDKKTLEDSPSYAEETALALVNSVGTDTEGGAIEFAPLGPSCKSANPRSECNSANQINYEFKECSLSSGKMSGGWTNTYNNTKACETAQDGALASGQSVTRTSSGLQIEGYFGGTLTFNTLTHATYDETTIPASGIKITNQGRYRSIEIGGAHRILKDSDGETLFDISVTSSSDILMAGTRSSKSRQVNAGTVHIYNNTEKYSAQITFKSVKWSQNTCCYPTSGSLKTSFEDSIKGTSTLEFTSECGQAKYTDVDGKEKNVELIQCE